MIIFAFTFLSIVWLAHYGLWRRLVRAPRWSRPWHLFGTAAALGGGAAVLAALLSRSMLPASFAGPLATAGFAWLGFIFYLLVFLLPAELLRTGYRFTRRSRPEAVDQGRRQTLIRLGAGGAVGAASLTSAFGVYEAASKLRVARVTVPIRGLAPGLAGYRIAQLSDVHIGAVLGRDFLERVVAQVNALKPDAVAITGDLVDGSVDRLRHDIAPLGELAGVDGTFFCTGNHEYYSGADAWCAHLESLGLKVLRNARHVVRRGAESLTFVGTDDMQARRFPGAAPPDLAAALRGYDRGKDGPTVLLAHQPKFIKEATKARIDLQLAGHTHGGQLVPFNWLVYLDQPFIAGLHAVGDTQIYVSKGTGFWGPPMRVGAPAEISLHTLVPA